ncbi:hypothetical protein OAK29_02005 [Gammaproteobacteria bacterium]|nr:hypothetical protein [Gammaproteobacteria bacterium]
MRDFITSLKSILKRFPRFLTVLRILRDPRYIYHTLQGYFTSPESRKKLRDVELKIFKRKQNNTSHTKEIHSQKGFQSLLDDGIVINPIEIDKKLLSNIRASLDGKMCHDPESPEHGYFKASEKPEGIKRAYYQCEDLGKIPGVLEIGNNSEILSYVSKYFGAVPIIDSVYAWWSFPSSDKALTQSYHRDIDTLHQLKFFIYLTDVDDDSGPHVYIKRSKNINLETIKDKSHEDSEIQQIFPEEDKLTIIGESGFNFLGDMFSFHKGLVPKKKPRLLLQFLYSLKRTPFGPKEAYIREDEIDVSKLGQSYREVNKYIII